MKKIAIVLSGCGNKDGTEITETISLMIALSQYGAKMSYFAPDMEMTPKNFINNESLEEKRNIKIESARITRGSLFDLKNLQADEFDGLAFPGGYGAALHLSNWADQGSHCEILPSVKKATEDFYRLGKPIAAICIAPVILARVLGKNAITITIGNDSETAQEIQKTGAIHKTATVTEHVVDRKHKIITSPAYMYDEAKPHEVFAGISSLAKEFMEML